MVTQHSVFTLTAINGPVGMCRNHPLQHMAPKTHDILCKIMKDIRYLALGGGKVVC